MKNWIVPDQSPRDKSEVELVFKGGKVEKIYVYTYTGFCYYCIEPNVLEELKREKRTGKRRKSAKYSRKNNYIQKPYMKRRKIHRMESGPVFMG